MDLADRVKQLEEKVAALQKAIEALTKPRALYEGPAPTKETKK